VDNTAAIKVINSEETKIIRCPSSFEIFTLFAFMGWEAFLGGDVTKFNVPYLTERTNICA